MSCSTDLVSGKTPIGVVSYVNGSTRIAIQLDKPDTMTWSSDYTNISGITNYSSSPDTTDFSGKSNTQAWVNYYGASATKYAPGYCNSYSKGGVRGWYLPAQGELYASIRTNQRAVDAGLSKAGGTSTEGGWHWSSSEYTNRHAWLVYGIGGATDWHAKVARNNVRCVLAF